MKKRALSVVLAILVAFTLTVPAFALNTDQQFLFVLSGSSGESKLTVEPGEEFTVEFYLNRTDSGIKQGETYYLFGMQDEIIYDTEYFEFMDEESSMLVNNFGDIVNREISGTTNSKVMVNSGMSSGDYPASLHVATLKFRALKSGTKQITNSNQIVILQNLLGATGATDEYESSVSDIEVIITGTAPVPPAEKYNISIDNPIGGMITTSPSGPVAAGTTVNLRITLNEGYSLSLWSVTGASTNYNGQINGRANVSSSFTMPAEDVTVSAALNNNNGGGLGGGGSTPGDGGPTTPNREIAIDDEEAPLAAPDIPRFDDVRKTHWAYAHIEYLSELGFVNGKTDTRFNPGDNITRGEFITILARMSGENLPEYKGEFTDVSAPQFYADPVAWGFAKGIVKGTSDTTFSPNANISRQDISTMIARYADYKGYTFGKVNEAIVFTDAKSIADYATDAVSSMQQANIINGYDDGSFKPRGNATRAESAKMLALVHHAMYPDLLTGYYD